MILALAGRRVDKEGEVQVRFSSAPESVDRVADRIRRYLQQERVTVLVCSAACGADLVALTEAGALGIRRRVVLASKPEDFRAGSVIDRPGDWGPIFDRVMAEVEARGDLVVAGATGGHSAYIETNHVIVEQALAIASKQGTMVTAVQVWEGKSRGKDDATDEFGEYARSRGLEVSSIATL